MTISIDYMGVLDNNSFDHSGFRTDFAVVVAVYTPRPALE